MALLPGDKLAETLRVATERLCNALRPSLIYLFGSYAYGTPNHDSDIDLLLLVDDTTQSPYELDAAANRALGDIRVPIDVQVYSRSDFERRAALPTSFERTVRDKGRVVYAA